MLLVNDSSDKKNTDKGLFPTIYSAVGDQGPNSIMFGSKSLENLVSKIMLLTRDAGMPCPCLCVCTDSAEKIMYILIFKCCLKV